MTWYQLGVAGTEADLDIFGDITSLPLSDSDVSAHALSKRLQELPANVSQVNVRINSYGGEVFEGIAIYNALRELSKTARVRTVCDGAACSIASVIFMAGDERIMRPTSLLMVHNAWTCACGNADDLAKAAEDLKTITGMSVAAYMAAVSIDEERLRGLMDAETFIKPEDALAMGFCTAIEEPSAASRPSQSAWGAVFRRIFASAQGEEPEPEPEAPEPEEPEPEPDEPGEPEERRATKQAANLAAFLLSNAI